MLRTPVLRSTTSCIKAEAKFLATNYSPLPVVFSTARGVTVTDPEGKKYLDFLSGYGAVNQGHLHPRIVGAVRKQLRRCTLSSRAFHSDQLHVLGKKLNSVFGYESCLPMNTGAEGVETALKLARKWAYKVKGVPNNQALIVCCNGNFHGRTFGAISMSDDPDSHGNYGPLLPGLIKVDFGDAKQLAAVFKKHHRRIAGFICEPIQGEAGVLIPPKGYLREVRRLCTKYNILFIDDEVQSGCGRTGKMLAVDHERVRPDVVILAKALGGGVLPVAAVLADKKHMVFEPGTHGSTFGGNPLACAVAVESLNVLTSERLPQRAAARGRVLTAALLRLQKEFPFIKAVRCRGLFSAVEFDHGFMDGKGAYALTKVLKKHGLLAKVTHGHTIRLTPPLVITEAQLRQGVQILRESLEVIKQDANKNKKK